MGNRFVADTAPGCPARARAGFSGKQSVQWTTHIHVPWYIPNPISAQHPVGSLAEYNSLEQPGGRSFGSGE